MRATINEPLRKRAAAPESPEGIDCTSTYIVVETERCRLDGPATEPLDRDVFALQGRFDA